MNTFPHIETPLTARQIGDIIGMHPVTVLKWARENRIPHRRLSARKIVFLASEIQEWLSTGSNQYTPGVGCAAQPRIEGEAA